MLNEEDAKSMDTAEQCIQFYEGQLVDCTTSIFDMIAKHPDNVDAIRALCAVATRSLALGSPDVDTEICLLREGLAVIRPRFALAILDGTFSTSLYPYFRFLFSFARLTIFQRRTDVAVAALEEIARFDPEDAFGARVWLLAGYVKLLARRDRAVAEGSDPGWYRDEEAVRVACRGLPESVAVWEDLVDLFLTYRAGDDWRARVDAIGQRDPRLWEGLVGHPVQPNASRGRVLEPLTYALWDYPTLAEEILTVTGSSTRAAILSAIRENPNTSWGAITRDMRAQRGMVADAFLQEARPLLATGRYTQAFAALTQARQYQSEAVRPGARWYVNAPWAIASNRARACERLGFTNLARLEARFTLMMRPSHVWSYELLARVSERYSAPDVTCELVQLAHEAKDRDHCEHEWRALAAKAIAWSSLSTIIAARAGGATPEFIEQAMRTGIEDVYTPINVDSQFASPPPWVTTFFQLSE
jgi:hypothetical protein